MESIIGACILVIVVLTIVCGALAYRYGLIKGKAIVYNSLLKQVQEQYFPKRK